MAALPVNALMVQGCTSDAGKSLLVTGLCRLLARRGVKVAPFKPQNMALNSAVTEDGGEIGRAQALQAQAAHVPLSVHMNPVLIKPNTDTGAQVIIQGQTLGNMEAFNFHSYKPQAAKAVIESFHVLNAQYPLIIVEGAGSPAEVNLREGDIANMGFAERVDCPVILIADIDKGGVFAYIVGTLECLSQSERDRIQGFVINKFRGDIALLQDGLDWLEAKTQKPVLGVLPYLHGFHIDSEDAIHEAQRNQPDNLFKVICPLLPHISNHTDFDALMLHPQVNFEFVRHDQPIPDADLVILPGSKNIAFDLDWLKQQGWPAHIQKHLRYAGKVMGICGGLQMLGQHILDPMAIESKQTETLGLGFMSYQTTLHTEKQLTQQAGLLNLEKPVSIKGYEIHQGITDFGQLKPAVHLANQQTDGAFSDDNQILVTYLHGLFDEPEALSALLNWAGLPITESFNVNQHREQQINRLADMLENNLIMELIDDILGVTNDNTNYRHG